MKVLALILALAVLAGCGASKHTTTSGYLHSVSQALEACRKEHKHPCKVLPAKPLTAKQMAKAVAAVERHAQGRMPESPFSAPTSQGPISIYAAPRLTGSELHAVLREVETICRERHLSCSEAEAAFGEGHAQEKASSRPISTSRLAELVE